MNRRHFLMSAAMMAGNVATRGLQSPNDTIRVAVIGLGSGTLSCHIEAGENWKFF